jgi:hypothetical protein
VKTMTFGGDPDRRGPAFNAGYGGPCSNDSCKDGSFEEGDVIRADGEGGWECASHKDDGE